MRCCRVVAVSSGSPNALGVVCCMGCGLLTPVFSWFCVLQALRAKLTDVLRAAEKLKQQNKQLKDRLAAAEERDQRRQAQQPQQQQLQQQAQPQPRPQLQPPPKLVLQQQQLHQRRLSDPDPGK